MYHRFSTETVVPAFDAREGDIVHPATLSCCGDVATVTSVIGGEDHLGGFVEVTIGCPCGPRMVCTMREEHVLSYSGTLALI